MCRVYHSIGSLRVLRSHLNRHGVYDFRSVKELIQFQKNYAFAQQEIRFHHTSLIEQEREMLGGEIEFLKHAIQRERDDTEKRLQTELEALKRQLDSVSFTNLSIVQRLANYMKKLSIRKKINVYELNFRARVDQAVETSSNVLREKTNRYQYISSHFEEAVDASSYVPLQELEQKRRIVEEVNSSIYGALGEQKVVKELEKLSDDYILINDFTCFFDPPVYHRQQNEYIGFLQIDHLLISPAGVFLIETKNWSEQSINSSTLRSPIQQIKRASFALFKVLSAGGVAATLVLNPHHWGGRKVPIKNLLVLINQKPREEFAYVKVLTLKELLGYVQYFQPSLTRSEVQLLADYLLRMKGQSKASSQSPA